VVELAALSEGLKPVVVGFAGLEKKWEERSVAALVDPVLQESKPNSHQPKSNQRI
jgi:hypothetical protein